MQSRLQSHVVVRSTVAKALMPREFNPVPLLPIGSLLCGFVGKRYIQEIHGLDCIKQDHIEELRHVRQFNGRQRCRHSSSIGPF